MCIHDLTVEERPSKSGSTVVTASEKNLLSSSGPLAAYLPHKPGLSGCKTVHKMHSQQSPCVHKRCAGFEVCHAVSQKALADCH